MTVLVLPVVLPVLVILSGYGNTASPNGNPNSNPPSAPAITSQPSAAVGVNSSTYTTTTPATARDNQAQIQTKINNPAGTATTNTATLIISAAMTMAPQVSSGPPPNGMLSSGPIVINEQDGTVIQRLRITSSTGDCVQINNSTNITIQNSEIGPCRGNGVKISGGSGINVFDSYIHPETLSLGCCDNNDGIFASGTSSLVIQGNVIAYGETNIEVHGGRTVTAIGNFLLNPRGPFPRGQNFQCWDTTGTGAGTPCSNVTIQNNYALSSTDTTRYLYPENQEDSLNFGWTNGIIAQNNYIKGGHSRSGCGLIADTSANHAQFKSNLLINTGQCGISIAGGTNQLVDGNKIYNVTPIVGGGNTALMTWNQHTRPCGPTTVSNNIADEIQPSGNHSGFWDGGGCSVTLSANTFGSPAAALLTPVGTVFAPPLIPPQPKNCVVISPYSIQTNWASCIP
jgi:hypothetical protein